ncbi:hypothetical protein [Gordonia sp. ABSL49_1]|uniref:glycoside hydrolase family 19 protein n=1 Tax=Gordonia sp. ABSL49_1 TaxID=2920941 RepID=UPI001F0F4D47|nr:hypothetical protein [Gordonia sp. ABSL49_1]MCH5645175.1 hypothetical protein [Gordonia sp. ABSL49_1]
MGWTLTHARYEQLLPAYLKAMQWANITTPDRAAMFAAQLGHESVGLKYQNEIADGSAYEWRSDLGNTQAGDGRRFKGHGWIQVTGRANHTAVSQWAYHQGIVPTPRFFVDNPVALGDDTYCWVGPAWYWTVARPQLNAMCDARDLVGVTRAINGGTNGLDDRRNRYNRCLQMGAALLPEEFLMALNDVEQKTVWSGAAQVNGASSSVRKAPAWLAKFLPKSFRDADGPWVRDEIDAIVNEVVTGTFTFSPDDTIDFGAGPVRLVDVPPTQPVNLVTLLRINAAHAVAAKGK